jgi:hypothetical protein
VPLAQPVATLRFGPLLVPFGAAGHHWHTISSPPP